MLLSWSILFLNLNYILDFTYCLFNPFNIFRGDKIPSRMQDDEGFKASQAWTWLLGKLDANGFCVVLHWIMFISYYMCFPFKCVYFNFKSTCLLKWSPICYRQLLFLMWGNIIILQASLVQRYKKYGVLWSMWLHLQTHMVMVEEHNFFLCQSCIFNKDPLLRMSFILVLEHKRNNSLA